MKKILLILLFLPLAYFGDAQPYKSMFGTKQTTWVMKYYNLDLESYAVADAVKDTIVNDISYKLIQCRYGIDWANRSIMREDTTTGKVWTRSLDDMGGDTTEHLIFDFSLDVGDTFDITNVAFGTEASGVVDSVRFIDGLKYIYFDRVYHSWDADAPVDEPFTFIEGIGCNAGPISRQLYSILQGQYLMCSSKNWEKTSYNNIRYGGYCYERFFDPDLAANNTEKPPGRLDIYPNPAHDLLKIKGIENVGEQPVGCNIYSLQGKLVKEIKTGNVNGIPVDDLPSGYYMLKLAFKKHPPQHIPFIVHH